MRVGDFAEYFFEQSDRLVSSPGVLVCEREAVADGEQSVGIRICSFAENLFK